MGRPSGRSPWIVAVSAVVACACVATASPPAPATDTLNIRGRPQTLHLYGRRGADPIVVSSSDGGWVRLGPHVAELLASRGNFVVGLDSKAYLESFTSGRDGVRLEQEPGDFAALVEYARRGSQGRPVLVGVSEGAGLSVLAATDATVKQNIAGVIGIGLPDVTELAWRWRDSIIYLTHGVPDEPTFSTAAIVDRVAPVPLVVIHASHDEFVPLQDITRILEHARDPKQLRVVEASNHRFVDALPSFDAQMIDAVAWARQHASR